MLKLLRGSYPYGLLFVILSAISWGLAGGFASLLMSKEWDPIVIANYQGIIGLILIFGWLIFNKNEKKISLSLVAWSILAGIGLSGGWGLYFVSISNTNLAVATTLVYTAPLFVFFISAILKTERITIYKFLALIFISLGIILLTGIHRTQLTGIHPWGIISGLLAGLSYAILIFSLKYGSEKGHLLIILNLAFLINSLILMIFADKQQLIEVLHSYDIWWFILLGFTGGGPSFILYVTGLKNVSPAVASIVAIFEPVTASLFGVIILNEYLTAVQAIGMVIILLTITILSYSSVKQNENNVQSDE